MGVFSKPTKANFWYVLSTDEKPVASNYGDEVYEYDTGDSYLWDGSSWILLPAVSTAVSDDDYIEKKPNFFYVSGSSAVASTLAPAAAWQLKELRIHLSDAGGAGDLTLTVDCGEGVAYDTVIFKQNMTSVEDQVWQPANQMDFEADDELDIAWANASNRTWGITVIWSLL
jgi:hypothetical protein